MVRNSPENKLSWVAGSIETKAISASNLKLKLTEAELGNNVFLRQAKGYGIVAIILMARFCNTIQYSTIPSCLLKPVKQSPSLA